QRIDARRQASCKSAKALTARSDRAQPVSQPVRPPSIRSSHFEHRIGTNFEIVTPTARTYDRARQRGLVHAVLDEGLIDVNGDHLAKRKPGLHFIAVCALQLNNL